MQNLTAPLYCFFRDILAGAGNLFFASCRELSELWRDHLGNRAPAEARFTAALQTGFQSCSALFSCMVSVEALAECLIGGVIGQQTRDTLAPYCSRCRRRAPLRGTALFLSFRYTLSFTSRLIVPLPPPALFCSRTLQ